MKKIYYKLKEIIKRGLDASRAYSIKEGARMDRECEETRLYMINRLENKEVLQTKEEQKVKHVIEYRDII